MTNTYAEYNGVFITKCPTRKALGYSPRFASRKSTRSAALQAGNTNDTLLAARKLWIEQKQYGPRTIDKAPDSLCIVRKGGAKAWA